MEFVNPLQFLKDKTILITDATGFLRKVFVEKIMRIQPNVKIFYLLVRATEAKSAMKRIIDEVEKDLFNVLRDKLGVNFKFFISKKVVAVARDVFEVNLGVKDSN
ncbi:probable fatty acyl-CoA reductase 4 [Pistacia vera]|uniref:probable fatty acyl-CoA reductase 4 n=1 Tax=Pistacia vera TaxID=55513 RepID=UPI00126398CD|nr:probable fatty acyl-CoA reductase 4 [Pistacia vera]